MPQILEQELEQYIFDNYRDIFKQKIATSKDEEGKEVIEYKYPTKILRQVEMGNYGRIDLLLFWEDEINIIELKQGDLDFNAFGQVARYMTGLENLYEDYPFQITGILIGKDIGSGDVCYIANHIHGIQIYTYELNLKTGIEFKIKHSGWCLTEEGFSSKNCKELLKEIPKLQKSLDEVKVEEIPF